MASLAWLLGLFRSADVGEMIGREREAHRLYGKLDGNQA